MLADKAGIKSQQQGVGMVEILVTLLILSVGLLGVAQLQFIGTMSNADALHRSQSVMIAQQMSERLRANAFMSTNSNGMIVDNGYFNSNIYNFDNLTCGGSGSNFECFCLALPATIPNCRTGNCTAAQFAVFDAYEISCAASRANPGMQVSLNCSDNDILDGDTCSAGSRHSIVLAWPTENWQNIDRSLNAECNQGLSEPHDCVVLDVTL